MKPVDRTSSLIMSGMLHVNPELRARRAPSACGFMSLENFRSLSRDVQDGTVGLVTLDCVDFEALAAGFGEDLGLMLLGVLLDKDRRLRGVLPAAGSRGWRRRASAATPSSFVPTPPNAATCSTPTRASASACRSP